MVAAVVVRLPCAPLRALTFGWKATSCPRPSRSRRSKDVAGLMSRRFENSRTTCTWSPPSWWCSSEATQSLMRLRGVSSWRMSASAMVCLGAGHREYVRRNLSALRRARSLGPCVVSMLRTERSTVGSASASLALNPSRSISMISSWSPLSIGCVGF